MRTRVLGRVRAKKQSRAAHVIVGWGAQMGELQQLVAIP
jgi:hypothetical protein